MNLNDENTLLDNDIFTAPFGVDVESYQARLNSICGLNEFGTPNLLLTWMPDIGNYTKLIADALTYQLAQPDYGQNVFVQFRDFVSGDEDFRLREEAQALLEKAAALERQAE